MGDAGRTADTSEVALGSGDGRSLLVASIAGLGINFLSSFFSGALAIVLLLLCVAALVFLLRHGTARGVAAPPWAYIAGSVDRLAFLAVSVVIGAVFGAVSILPILPLVFLPVPWTALFDPKTLEYGSMFPGYELLAAALIVALASVALFRRQHFVRVLGFAIAALGGAVAVFSAFGPSFDSPTQTFAGWSIATALVLGILVLTPRGLRSLAEFFNVPAKIAPARDVENEIVQVPRFRRDRRNRRV